jgi:hypothetical protein
MIIDKYNKNNINYNNNTLIILCVSYKHFSGSFLPRLRYIYLYSMLHDGFVNVSGSTKSFRFKVKQSIIILMQQGAWFNNGL